MTAKPRALDLFCCGGGASMGLSRAGFDVTGIDIRPQPHYPFRFIQANALEPDIDLRQFDFIWASPPCQKFTALRHLQIAQKGKRCRYPNLIPATRHLLKSSGVRYCIENVPGAPLRNNSLRLLLCGSMFGLQTTDGRAELRRHRYFELSFLIPESARLTCRHGGRESLSVTGNGLDSNRERWARRRCISVVGNGSPRVWDTDRSTISVYGDHARDRRRAITVTGSTPQTNVERNRDRRTFSIHDARVAMDIDWLPMRWLSQAIPPPYAEFIGHHALREIGKAAA